MGLSGDEASRLRRCCCVRARLDAAEEGNSAGPVLGAPLQTNGWALYRWGEGCFVSFRKGRADAA